MNDEWEEVPQEDLWQDGELDSDELKNFIYLQVVQQGVWKLVRRREWKPVNKHKQTPTVL